MAGGCRQVSVSCGCGVVTSDLLGSDRDFANVPQVVRAVLGRRPITVQDDGVRCDQCGQAVVVEQQQEPGPR